MNIPAHAQAARANNKVNIRKNESIRTSPTRNNEMDIETYFARVRLFIFSYIIS
jgi:hypothetical protein